MPHKLTDFEIQLMERSYKKDCISEKREINREERSVVHYISTKTADSFQTIFLPDGFDLRRIEKTRSVFYSHMYREYLPIGGMMWLKSDDFGLLAKTRFARTQMGEDLWLLNQDDMIRGWSIGADPMSWVEKGSKDFDEIVKKYKLEGNFDIIFPTALLYEYSQTGMPSNEDCTNRIRQYIQDGKLKSDILIRDLGKHIGENKSLPIQLTETDQDIEKRPYPNYHSCRLRNPDDYKTCRYEKNAREHEGKKYDVNYCQRKDDESKWEEQAYRYDKEVWSADQAESHCKYHKGKFEAASEEKKDIEQVMQKITEVIGEAVEKAMKPIRSNLSELRHTVMDIAIKGISEKKNIQKVTPLPLKKETSGITADQLVKTINEAVDSVIKKQMGKLNDSI